MIPHPSSETCRRELHLIRSRPGTPPDSKRGTWVLFFALPLDTPATTGTMAVKVNRTSLQDHESAILVDLIIVFLWEVVVFSGFRGNAWHDESPQSVRDPRLIFAYSRSI